ncbi:MAG: GIY-YIG nuclease family protein [Ignavibacteria bacterium]|nr:GIY-YIG nuclease family protein [Ignavibacteria bacterium]
MHYVYVLQSTKDGKRYVGITNNIIRRLRQHNSGRVPATKGRKPLALLRLEEFDDRSEAAQREKYSKSGLGRKELEQLLNL